MKIGITYDIKEAYGFNTLDINFTDFMNAADVTYIKETLEKCGHCVTLIGNSTQLITFLSQNPTIDLVFNLSWGYRGRNREGLIPAVLEAYNIPHTGTDAFGCSLCLDKIQTKLIASYLQIPTPQFFVVTNDNLKNFCSNIPIPFPMVLKPSREGTGMGVTLVNTYSEYIDTLKKLLKLYNEPILCEEYIEGDEVTVPLLENEKGIYAVDVLSILTVGGKPIPLYDASIKTAHTYKKQLSTLSPQINDKVKEYSCSIFSFMQGNGYGRADFRISEEGIPYFLEMAPLPLLAPYSSFNLCTSLVGMTDEEVLLQIIQSACKKYKIEYYV